jgi:hypothetical protein
MDISSPWSSWDNFLDWKLGNTMRPLEYRSPRIQTEFCVDFLAGNDFFRGTCIDVSENGIRGFFEENIAMNRVGSLILHHPRCQATVPARVVYLMKGQVGFAFFQHTGRDLDRLSHFIAQAVVS